MLFLINLCTFGRCVSAVEQKQDGCRLKWDRSSQTAPNEAKNNVVVDKRENLTEENTCFVYPRVCSPPCLSLSFCCCYYYANYFNIGALFSLVNNNF